ncbi:DUF1566 domain-containing protein [Alteromonas aestuariivivens]|uniref:DUF1566 domain-containing protein n=1 Tax=Alteromonas aestuariivivens TaxID=1938339 RepID=A0A3D8M3Z7_9ALTE|nr:DUF1566 domain-containing protein [Alteromonas aestuariivivens]RDV24338.1 DUF1566 domain-containing protein [Alteromonas aestuariivivens]
MQFSSSIRWFYTALIAIGCAGLVSACGGGAESSSSTVLYINAGADREVTEQSVATLSATVSGNSETLTYRWTVSPALSIVHPDTGAADAIFTAPIVSVETDYTFTVRVTDDQGNTASDTLIVIVVPDNALPVADIQVPQWSSLPTNYFPAGVAVTLDGSASSDADTSNQQNPISSWHWEQTSGTDVVADAVTNQPTLSFVTPIANQSQTLVFELTITDEEGATDRRSVALHVQSASETLPVVDVGLNQGVFSGEPIIFNGEASTTVPGAHPLEVQWIPDGQLDFTIQSPTSLSTFAVAPEVDELTEITVTLQVTDANNNRVEKLITVAVRPFPTPVMNDTGISIQATDNDITQTHQNAFPGQDAQRGQDVIASNGLIEKAGRGLAGFDFTRLDEFGEQQDDSGSDWSCVRDNVTGLVWEVKTDDGGLQDTDNLYSWYASADNGGAEGELHGDDAVCTLSECNTEAFVDTINSQGLCGFYDWRLPTHFELMSIMHFGLVDGAMLDPDYFPYTGRISEGELWYWTNQPGADGVLNDQAQNAWALDFVSGVDSFLNKASAARIRLVRAGR